MALEAVNVSAMGEAEDRALGVGRNDGVRHNIRWCRLGEDHTFLGLVARRG